MFWVGGAEVMRTLITATVSGILFGAGLALSGMMNPAKVIGFLDLFGDWDPSLAFVMAGAMIVAMIGYRIGRHRSQPAFDSTFHLPTRTAIDRHLILGAVLFGLGWGIAGLCPGPALAALVTGSTDILIFTAAMMLGIYGFSVIGPH
jgi:uncharacterized protein